MEIERKFTIKTIPENLDSYPHHRIQQGYLNVSPVVRVRMEGDNYILTYKGSGMMAREEHNLALNEEAYHHLLPKVDGNIISKTRYLIPLEHPSFREGFPTPPEDYSLTIELDEFHKDFSGIYLAEVEFLSEEAADAFVPPAWFSEEVTYDGQFHNSHMSRLTKEQCSALVARAALTRFDD